MNPADEEVFMRVYTSKQIYKCVYYTYHAERLASPPRSLPYGTMNGWMYVYPTCTEKEEEIKKRICMHVYMYIHWRESERYPANE